MFSEFGWFLNPTILSAKTIFCSFLLLISFGSAIAYFLAFSHSRFKKFVNALVIFPLIFPPIATGFLLLFLLGKNGVIGKFFDFNLVFSFKALVIAAFLAGLPLFVKPFVAVLKSFPRTLIEAGMSLGKSDIKIFFFIIVPNIYKSIAAALILALARGLGEVGITLMLGGNIIGKTDTISLAIFNAVYDGETTRALILSMILVILSLSLFYVINKLEKKAS